MGERRRIGNIQESTQKRQLIVLPWGRESYLTRVAKVAVQKSGKTPGRIPHHKDRQQDPALKIFGAVLARTSSDVGHEIGPFQQTGARSQAEKNRIASCE